MFHQCKAYFLLTFEYFTGEQLLPGANHCTKIFNFFSKYLRITILIGLSQKISKKKFKVPIDKGLKKILPKNSRRKKSSPKKSSPKKILA